METAQTTRRHSSSLIRTMRSLHRDIGFLVIGLTMLYAISGIVLIYRESDVFKTTEAYETTLDPNLSSDQLSRALREHHLRVLEDTDTVIRYEGGQYDKTTGLAVGVRTSFPAWLDALNTFHMQSSRTLVSVFSTIYGALLLFLAISSFWMYKPGSRNFVRGLALATTGLALSVVVVVI